MNTYRVDVNNEQAVPCGMNSLRYIGDNWESARRMFDKEQAGFDAWHQENCTYGVILSVWDGKEYVIKATKGL